MKNYTVTAIFVTDIILTAAMAVSFTYGSQEVWNSNPRPANLQCCKRLANAFNIYAVLVSVFDVSIRDTYQFYETDKLLPQNLECVRSKFLHCFLPNS